ncbi:MAG: ribonuclease D [Rhodospirillales bacterium]|jgi:ribonuclease D|nr:ribonuclease D [Rhodospirillales bacterium]
MAAHDRLIVDSAALAAICRQFASESFISVDTEFMREKTYWSRLCLVQLAGSDRECAIDPLAEGIDFAPLYDLLSNAQVLKVFHAARQDLEIFFHRMGRLPAPIFDTQIAAMVCGFGDQVAYDRLVAKLTGERIDKAFRFTDWSLRPLRDRQIEYAISDVTHLRAVYERLSETLAANGREPWLTEEISELINPRTYAADPRESYRRIGKIGRASPRFLAILRELAAWRDTEAQRLDIPRARVLRDEALVEIAHHPPSTAADLGRVRLGRGAIRGRSVDEVLAAVRRGLSVPESDRPRADGRETRATSGGPLVDLLKVLLKAKCDEYGVAQKLVASSAEIEGIAAEGDNAPVRALHGWRRDVFGQDALKLLRGEMALAAKGNRLTVVSIAPASTLR